MAEGEEMKACFFITASGPLDHSIRSIVAEIAGHLGAEMGGCGKGSWVTAHHGNVYIQLHIVGSAIFLAHDPHGCVASSYDLNFTETPFIRLSTKEYVAFVRRELINRLTTFLQTEIEHALP